jgi:cytochrome c oxidase subunit 2
VRQVRQYLLRLITGAFVLAVWAARPATSFASPAWPVVPTSPAVNPIKTLFWVILGIAAVIFIAVEGVLLYNVVRFRARAGHEEGDQISNNTPLEITWTAIPLVILVALYIFMIPVMRAAANPPADSLHVNVVGHQWWWEFQYPDDGVQAPNELHIPVGRPIRLTLQSADVIHDFWVPELGAKEDLIPGQANETWIEAQTPGTYKGQCNVFCGPQHAGMLITVIAEPPADFDAWLQDQRTPAPQPSGGLTLAGQQYFLNGPCIACHAIDGTPADAHVGPDLSHVASRTTLAAGVITNTPANLTRWLSASQEVKPESKMPDFHLPSEEVNALAAYLDTLK